MIGSSHSCDTVSLKQVLKYLGFIFHVQYIIQAFMKDTMRKKKVVSIASNYRFGFLNLGYDDKCFTLLPPSLLSCDKQTTPACLWWVQSLKDA